MVTDAFNHAPGQILMSTGSQQFGKPSLGAWTLYGLGSESRDLPGFVVFSTGKKGPSGGNSNWGSGFLPTHEPGSPVSDHWRSRCSIFPIRLASIAVCSAIRSTPSTTLNQTHLDAKSATRRFRHSDQLVSRWRFVCRPARRTRWTFLARAAARSRYVRRRSLRSRASPPPACWRAASWSAASASSKSFMRRGISTETW